MKFTRRDLLKVGGLAAAGLALPKRGLSQLGLLPGTPKASLLWINRFTQGLAIPPVALPVNRTISGVNYDYYELGVREFSQHLSPLMGATKFWGYSIEGTQPHIGGTTGPQGGVVGYLGGIVIAQKGRPVKLHIQNLLTDSGAPDGNPLTHVIRAPGSSQSAVDNTMAGSPKLYSGVNAIPGGALENRIATHLHGGLVKDVDDGHPLSWYSNDSANNHGQYYPLANGNVYTYPNNQSSRLIWYHDHAESITRLNAYAGIATGYIIRDTAEADLVSQRALPPFIESSLGAGVDIQEYPLILQEKMFDFNDQLYYHCNYDPGRWSLQNMGTPAPYPSCIPEFFGDVTLVNGVPWPALPVKKGIYRFRILAAAQARFYNLQLFYAKVGGDNKLIPDLTKPGPQFYQIGNECGFLPAPVRVTKLLLAPAERADVLVDFTNIPEGSKLILYSKAPAPYPGGDPINDYIDLASEVSMPGTLMQFEVIGGALGSNSTLGVYPATKMPATLPAIAAVGAPNVIRQVSLNEGWDQYGRLAQLLGNFHPTGAQNGGFGAEFLDPTTSVPTTPEQPPHRNGTTEEWTLVNNTGDVHPMHFHLDNVQIVSRQAIDMAQFNSLGTVRPVGPAMGPDPNERGNKETVRCYPGQLIRVRMKVESGYTGHYVWHCHILEHEEHDMMQEFDVV